MTLLATFKHISSKNADYGAAEAYLTFEHDEFTMKPTLDENGRLIPREDYRISSLNCGGEDFAVACMRANLRYEKNQKREDVKSHHYIISFDPRDGTDNGLTVDQAQELGEKFCKEHFPGHQALVCTHPDGHNHSGNIHVHIVINSLRIYEVPLLPYMDRPADTRAGCKHRCTNAAMEYFKSEVMEMCHREGLYQIDLLNGSKERITEREYWAAKKGQLALDKENATREAAGQPTKPTKFETDKAKLRRTIRQALSQATSFDEFSSLLLREGVTVKESRGRLSYLTPDRTKPITARKLGDDFDKAAVLALLTQNAHRAAKQTKAIPEYPVAVKKPSQGEKPTKTTPADNTLQRMVDREAKRAEGKGVGYDRWAAKYNLKQMAATVTAYQQYGFSSPEELDEACSAAYAAMQESLTELKVNNFLEKKRIKNLDEDTFVLKKGDFEPIVSEALWRLCERIRKSRIKKYQMPSGEERRRGSRIPQHLWVKKLRCRCGAGYNRFKWRVLQDGTPIYGYQCNYRTQNPAKSFVEKNHLAGQKSCDAISICEWKLDLMAKQIFDQLWGDQRQAVLKACQMIESCMLAATMQSDVGRAELQRKVDKLEQRILNLGQMRADGELTKEQYQKLYAQATKELEALQGKMGGQPDESENVNGFDLDKIKKGLSQMVDTSTPKISEELIEEFVEVVTPVENHHYRWKMSFGETKTAQERSNLLEPENPPVLTFTIDFETARKFRYANGLPRQFRKRDWNDLIVEVYL